MRQPSVIIALAVAMLLPSVALAQDVSGFEARSFPGTKLTLPYRLFKVQNPEAGKTYPLILFLHGAGERGNDNTAQLTANAGATVWTAPAHQALQPAYVIAPQCPADQQWVDTDWTQGSYSTAALPVSDELATALEIADAVADEFPVDPRRHYITGLSMGGYGTWDAVIRNPERFAAAIPICGAGDPSQAQVIVDLPIWTAHGDADSVVPVTGTREMVSALMALGSTIQYSEYPGVDHDSWTQTYENEAIITWLFEQQRPVSPGSGGSAGSGGSGGGTAGSEGGSSSSGTGGSAGLGGAATAGAGPAGSAGTTTSSAGTAGASAAGSPTMPSAPSNDSGGCRVLPGVQGEGLWVTFAAASLALLVIRRRRPAQRDTR